MAIITGLSLDEAKRLLGQCLDTNTWHPDDHILFDHVQRFPKDATNEEKTVEVKRMLWEGLLTLNVGYESDTFLCIAKNDLSRGPARIAIAFYEEDKETGMVAYHFYRSNLWQTNHRA